jgi:hypothetical protein
MMMVPAYSADNNELVFCGVSKSSPLPLSEENFRKIGYKVIFPDAISDDLELKDVSIGVGLSVKITEAQVEKIQQTMAEAIEGDSAFKSLRDYSPYRQTGAFYLNDDRSRVVVVSTMPADKYDIVEKAEFNPKDFSGSFKVSGVDCFWVSDAESPTLSFNIGKINFMLFSIVGNPLSKEEASELAVAVIKSNVPVK